MPLTQPRSILLAKYVSSLQAFVMLAVAVLAAVYSHRANYRADGSLSDVDHQFTAIGWGIAAVVAFICVLLLGLGVRRFGSGAGRGRTPLILGQALTFWTAYGTFHAAAGAHGRGALYPTVLILTVFAAVAVLIAMNLPAARRWARRPKMPVAI